MYLTDDINNCTILGAFDCNGFYKWIPLKHYTGLVAISLGGIPVYTICILCYVPFLLPYFSDTFIFFLPVLNHHFFFLKVFF